MLLNYSTHSKAKRVASDPLLDFSSNNCSVFLLEYVLNQIRKWERDPKGGHIQSGIPHEKEYTSNKAALGGQMGPKEGHQSEPAKLQPHPASGQLSKGVTEAVRKL